MKAPKTYLGDAVYAEFNGWDVVLTTSNGIEETNKIYLDPKTLAVFLAYVKALDARAVVLAQQPTPRDKTPDDRGIPRDQREDAAKYE